MEPSQLALDRTERQAVRVAGGGEQKTEADREKGSDTGRSCLEALESAAKYLLLGSDRSRDEQDRGGCRSREQRSGDREDEARGHRTQHDITGSGETARRRVRVDGGDSELGVGREG